MGRLLVKLRDVFHWAWACAADCAFHLVANVPRDKERRMTKVDCSASPRSSTSGVHVGENVIEARTANDVAARTPTTAPPTVKSASGPNHRYVLLVLLGA